MRLLDNKLYKEDIDYVANIDIDWSKLENKSVMITGASGMMGSFLIDVLMAKKDNLHCMVYALGRNESKAKERFVEYWDEECFSFVAGDINEGIHMNGIDVNYIIHAASNTHPVAYATDPIGTITTNIIGTHNLLEFAAAHNTERFVFASSNEIYGENRGDVEKFTEEYCGYINSNTLRAGYPESKRCGEALCQAYIRQKGIDVVVPRLTRSYGPTMLMSDTKAISQFIRKGIAGENIVLKSEGTQFYSYTYVADAVAGLLTVMLRGETGEAYNIADEKSDITLRDLAKLIADINGTEVVFELPDAVESAGFSKATKARLESAKLQRIGWSAKYSIQEGMQRTIEILKSLS